MKKCCLITVLLIPLSLAGKDRDRAYTMGSFVKGQKVAVLGDNVRVRSAPNPEAPVEALLPLGTDVTIIEKTDAFLRLRGYRAPWYRVSFSHEGGAKGGYLWGGLLAMVSRPLERSDGAPRLIAGMDRFDRTRGRFTAVARIVRDRLIEAELRFEPICVPVEDGSFYYSVSGKVMDGRGLEGVEHIIILTFEYPACGYPNGDVVLLYDGNRLYHGVKVVSVAEAGVYHLTTRVIYPDEKEGMTNRIIVVETAEEFDEAAKSYHVKEIKKKILRWNGSGFEEEKVVVEKRK